MSQFVVVSHDGFRGVPQINVAYGDLHASLSDAMEAVALLGFDNHRVRYEIARLNFVEVSLTDIGDAFLRAQRRDAALQATTTDTTPEAVKPEATQGLSDLNTGRGDG